MLYYIGDEFKSLGFQYRGKATTRRASPSVTGVKFAKCSEISSRAETEVETQALARVKVYRSVRLKCYGGYSCYNFMPSIHSESSDRREGQRQRHRETETDTDRKLERERERDSWTDRQTYF